MSLQLMEKTPDDESTFVRPISPPHLPHSSPILTLSPTKSCTVALAVSLTLSLTLALTLSLTVSLTVFLTRCLKMSCCSAAGMRSMLA